MADAKEEILKMLKAKKEDFIKNKVPEDKKKIYDISVSEFLYPAEEQTKKFFEVATTQTGEYKISGTEKKFIEKMLKSKEFEKAIAAEDLTITEFGCGNGVKAYTIINSLPKQIKNVVYFPVDISKYMIDGTLELMKKCKGFDDVEIHSKGKEEGMGFTKQMILKDAIDYGKGLNFIIENLNVLLSLENYKNFRSRILDESVALLKNQQGELSKLQALLEQKELKKGSATLLRSYLGDSFTILSGDIPYLIRCNLQGNGNELRKILQLCEKHMTLYVRGLNEFASNVKKYLGEKKDIRRIIVAPMNINFRNIEGIYSVIDMFSASKGKNLVLFLGQTFGNFHSEERKELLSRMNRALKKNDLLLIGVELIYDKAKIIAAYKDKKIENFFNETIKVAGFDLEDVEYDARFNNTCVEILFRVNKDTAIGKDTKVGEVSFKEGDEIIVAISYKFPKDEISNLIEAGFKIEFWPKNDEYALILCSKP